MKKRRLTIIIIVLALLIMIGMPSVLLWRLYHQERLNRDLIAAIKNQNRLRVLELLSDGADANTRAASAAPSFAQMLRRLFDQFRRSDGKTAIVYHPSALILASRRIELTNGRGFSDNLPDEEIVLGLLDHGANPNVREDGNRANPLSPIGYAIWLMPRSVLRRLLECGANPNAPAWRQAKESGEFYDLTPLILVSAFDGHGTETMRLLVEHGADVNEIDSDGGTPLMETVRVHNLVGALWLLQHGAKTGVKDKKGLTALELANEFPTIGGAPNARKMVTLLKQYGATK